MTINLRRDAWKDDRQFDDIRSIALEIERLTALTVPRFGTWSPGLSFGGSASGITFSVQEGYWMKQGSLVICTGAITVTNNGTGVGNALLTNLPFTVKDILPNAGADGFGRFTFVNNIGAALDDLFLYPVGGQKHCEIFKIAAGGTNSTSAQDTDITSTFVGRVFVVFFTDEP